MASGRRCEHCGSANLDHGFCGYHYETVDYGDQVEYHMDYAKCNDCHELTWWECRKTVRKVRNTYRGWAEVWWDGRDAGVWALSYDWDYREPTLGYVWLKAKTLKGALAEAAEILNCQPDEISVRPGDKDTETDAIELGLW